MRQTISTPFALIATALLLVACSGAGDPIPDGGAADAGETADAGEIIPGPAASCDEIDSIECFSNYECGADERCHNVGAEGADEVPCCITGARGTRVAGDACDPELGQTQCESGVCVQGNDQSRCSGTCVTDTDCPEGMQRCTVMMFSTTEDDWCMPE